MLAAHFKYLISDHRLPLVGPHAATVIHEPTLLIALGANFFFPLKKKKSHKDWESWLPGKDQSNKNVPGFEKC